MTLTKGCRHGPGSRCSLCERVAGRESIVVGFVNAFEAGANPPRFWAAMFGLYRRACEVVGRKPQVEEPK